MSVKSEIAEKARLDGEYIEKMSFRFDMKCIFLTALKVIRHDGVVEGGTGSMLAGSITDKKAEKEPAAK